MAYQNYNPYLSPYQAQPFQMQTQTFQAPQQTQNGMIWVAGLSEASNYPVCPNSAVNLWDSTAPCVYIKSADATGRPSLKIYDLVERSQQAQAVKENLTPDYITRTEFEEWTAKVERLTAPKAKKKEETVNE